MKRNRRRGSKKHRQTIQVWTHEQATRALPYVASIVRTLRDTALETQQHEFAVERLARTPGRPTRNTLIERDESLRAAERSRESFDQALDELHTLDIYSLDPVRGQALIPFAQGEQLAWYVYDLFDEQPLCFWRYHEDPLETRRSISEAPEGPAPDKTFIV
jgi:hypothetical protein